MKHFTLTCMIGILIGSSTLIAPTQGDTCVPRSWREPTEPFAPTRIHQTHRGWPELSSRSMRSGDVVWVDVYRVAVLERGVGFTLYRIDERGDWKEEIGSVSIEGARFLAPGDLNHDGVPDIYVATEADEEGVGRPDRVFFSELDGSGLEESSQVLEPSDSVSASIADFDKDGLQDVIVAQRGSAPNTIYTNTRVGELVASETILGDGEGLSVTVGDWDRDGSLDVYMLYADQTGAVWFGGGDGTFEKGQEETFERPIERVWTVQYNHDRTYPSRFGRSDSTDCLVLLGDRYQSVRSTAERTGAFQTRFEAEEENVVGLAIDFINEDDYHIIATRDNSPALAWLSTQSDPTELPELLGGEVWIGLANIVWALPTENSEGSVALLSFECVGPGVDHEIQDGMCVGYEWRYDDSCNGSGGGDQDPTSNGSGGGGQDPTWNGSGGGGQDPTSNGSGGGGQDPTSSGGSSNNEEGGCSIQGRAVSGSPAQGAWFFIAMVFGFGWIRSRKKRQHRPH